jgi:hypothetical protein
MSAAVHVALPSEKDATSDDIADTTVWKSAVSAVVPKELTESTVSLATQPSDGDLVDSFDLHVDGDDDGDEEVEAVGKTVSPDISVIVAREELASGVQSQGTSPLTSLVDLMGCAVASVVENSDQRLDTSSCAAATVTFGISCPEMSGRPSVCSAAQGMVVKSELPGRVDLSCEKGVSAIPAAELRTLEKGRACGPAPFASDLAMSADQNGDDDAALADEWEAVAAWTEDMRLKEKTLGVARPVAGDDLVSAPIVYREVERWLMSIAVDPVTFQSLSEETVAYTRWGCIGKTRSRTDISGLDRRHSKDKDLLLFLKFDKFDFNVIHHFRMLRTMYVKVTRNKVCPSIGGHWQELGFQASDPRTDLNRSGCVLNILHMFYFFTHYFDIFKSTYLLAQDPEQNFPFACISINISGLVVNALLDGRLTKLCNASDRGLFETCCHIHAAALHYFYKEWKAKKRTIRDTEKTLNELRCLLKSKPRKLLQDLQKGDAEMKARTNASRLEFTELDFGGARGLPQREDTDAEVDRMEVRDRIPQRVPTRMKNYAAPAC